MKRLFDQITCGKCFFILFLFALCLASCEPKQQSIEDRYETPTASGLYYMMAYPSQYPKDINLWTTEPLAARLKKMLGDQFENFMANIEVQSEPIKRAGSLIYVTGNKEKGDAANAAVMIADVENDALYIWLVKDKQLKQYKEKETEPSLPDDVKKFLAGLQGS